MAKFGSPRAFITVSCKLHTKLELLRQFKLLLINDGDCKKQQYPMWDKEHLAMTRIFFLTLALLVFVSSR
jgi:hypothetical protein